MEFRQLNYLDAVYRYKSFTKASRTLYVSQPTISASVKAVENELGIVLIERNSKTVVFTHEGEQIMLRIHKLLSDYNDMICEAHDLAKHKNNIVRLGIASILSADLFPIIYKDFLPLHHDLTIRLDEDSALGQISKLINDELDVAFNGLPEMQEYRDMITTIPVCKREVKLVMNKNHRLANYDKVSIEDFGAENLSTITSPGVMGKIINEELTKRNLQPQIMSEHSQIHGMFEMLLTGCSVGVMNFTPYQTKIDRYDDLIVKSFEEPIMFDVGFIIKKNKYLSDICRELMDFITDKLSK